MAQEDLSLFPISTDINSQDHLCIAGHDLTDLARTYATPLYVYDGATVRGNIASLQTLFKRYYPGEAVVAYASKAYFSHALAKKLAALGVGVDVVSLAELNIAQSAGFDSRAIHLHGNNKSEAELQAAINGNIQAIVVDSLDELSYLEQMAARMGKQPNIWLRITPDLNIDTHPHIETSHPDSKFGLHIQNGEAMEALRRALASKWVRLTGLHTHLGSQIFDVNPYRQAVRTLFEVAERENFIPAELSPGGGWGARYTSEDPNDDPESWVQTVSGVIQEECIRLDWPFPKMVLEPGRWVVARAGVAIYQVGAQKTTPSGIHIVAVDGGLADNSRVALYQAHYSARRINEGSAVPTQKVRVVGRFCESGDVLIPEITLPALRRGDLLAIPVAGAYQLSMASNYNLADRPTVLWLDEGTVEVMQSREKPDQPGWWVYSGIKTR